MVTPAYIAPLVASLWTKRPTDSVIGIHSPDRWTGPDRLTLNGEAVEVATGRSALEIRERLSARTADSPRLVIITMLDESDLGSDVLARLAKRQLLRIEPWEIVREKFQAQIIDPRLAKHAWMAEALLESLPADGCRPAPGGILSMELASGVLLDAALGLPVARPDGETLLRWSMHRENIDRFSAARRELQEAVMAWVAESAGSVGTAIVRCIARGRGHDALPVGLVCGVVFDPTVQDVTLARAAVRLEEYIGRGWDTGAVARWGALANDVIVGELQTKGIESARPWLARAEQILAEVGARDHAYRSRVLPVGLQQRLDRFAATIEQAMTATNDTALADVAVAGRTAHQHEMMRFDEERGARAQMADRLCRCLRVPIARPGSFADLATAYAAGSAFVDWARTALRGGDANPKLSAAYEQLLALARQRREDENRAFAEFLQGWLDADSDRPELLPIEEVLPRVVAPLGQHAPVLLLVLDGLSYPVFEELAADLTLGSWTPLRPIDGNLGSCVPSAPPVIAAIPTVTEVCRASLLCGRLTEGGQTVEKQGFAEHPDLKAVSKTRFPPVLFHKGELIEASQTDLSAAVQAEIASPDRRVVGVVLNAVDDHLLKADQVRPRWTVDYVRLLRPILEAAQEVGRVVIITSDHGHVIDMDTELRRSGQSDRWRIDDGSVAADEVVLAGRRVLTATGSRLIALWSERIRYCNKKNGYHGGAAPQEVVVPLGVFAPSAVHVDGWEATNVNYPSWWEETLRPSLPPLRTAPQVRPIPKKGQADLFSTVPPLTPSPWLDALLSSEVFAGQKAAAGRVVPPDDKIRAFFVALDERGGKLTRAALAQKLGLPPVRVPGTIAAMRRLLNVDGYEVLSLDEDSDTITLNMELLRVQFELPG